MAGIPPLFGSGSGYAGPERLFKNQHSQDGSIEELTAAALERVGSQLADQWSYLLQMGMMWGGDLAGYGARILLRRRGFHNLAGLFLAQILCDEGASAVVTCHWRAKDNGLAAWRYEFKEGLVARLFLMGGMRAVRPLTPRSLQGSLLSFPVQAILFGALVSAGGMVGEELSRRTGSEMPTTPRTGSGFFLRWVDATTGMVKGGAMRQALRHLPLPRRLGLPRLDSDEIMGRLEARHIPVIRSADWTTITHSSGETGYWNDSVKMDEVIYHARNGDYGKIPPPPDQFGDVKIRWQDTMIYGKDGTALLMRVQEIPRPDRGEVKMAAWLISLNKNGADKIGPAEEKQGRVLAAYFGEKVEHPFRDIQIRGGGKQVRFDRWDPRLGYVREGRLDPRAFLDSIAYYLDTVYEAKFAAYGLQLMDTRYDAFKKGVDQAYFTTLAGPFRLFYGELGRIVAALERRGDGWLAAKRTDYPTIARVIRRQLEVVHRLGEAAVRDESETFNRLEEEFGKTSFEFEGERYSTFRGVMAGLRKIADPEKRRALLQGAARRFDDFHAERGNLYDTITRMNVYARQAGLPDFVDHWYLARFGFTAREFLQRFDRFMEETREPAMRYVGELSRLKQEIEGDGTVHAWDIDYLEGALIRRRIGGEEPTLTAEQAAEVADALYRDLGFEMKDPPYNRVIEDLVAREGKAVNQGMSIAIRLGHAYFTSNATPGGTLFLANLETKLHERCHSVHFVTAAETAKPHYFLSGEYTLAHWLEGVAKNFGNLLRHPGLARHYLAKYPQFTEAYFRYLEEVDPLREAFWLRRQMLLAWMEVNLYQDVDPTGRPRFLQDRKKAWTAMSREVLGIEDAPDGVSFWTTVPHYTYHDYHLFMPSYPLGQAMVDRLFNAYVREGTVEELRRYGEVIRGMMRRGVRVTNEEIDHAATAPVDFLRRG